MNLSMGSDHLSGVVNLTTWGKQFHDACVEACVALLSAEFVALSRILSLHPLRRSNLCETYQREFSHG